MSYTRRGALGLAVGGAAALASTARAQGTRAEVPFRLRDNQPLTAVQINGQGPFTFLIDTGAMAMVVKISVAQQIGLEQRGTADARGAVGRTGPVPVYFARQVDVAGGLREPNSYLIGIPALEGSRADGLFPFPQNVREIGMDFDRQRLILDRRPPETWEGFERIPVQMSQATMMGRGQHRTFDPRPRISGTFGGRPINLVIDTGAQGGLFLKPDYVRGGDLWNRYARRSDSVGMGVAGGFRTRFVIAEQLQIGRYRFESPPVTLGHPDDADRDGWGGADGLLGMEFLRRLNFYLRPRDDAMWVRASGHFDDSYRYNRSGAYLRWNEGRVEVIGVAEDSPAARAGLEEGDVIAASSVEGGAFEALVWALQDSPGTTIRMAVDRSGSRRETEIVLAEPFTGGNSD